jgi:hypothetical protein
VTGPADSVAPRTVVWLLRICAVWTLACTAFLALGTALSPEPVVRAVLGMALRLAVVWVGAAGGLMFGLRQRIRVLTRRFDRWPRGTFVVFATGLALVEEAVTTTMTNLAPLWGVPMARAHVTACTFRSTSCRRRADPPALAVPDQLAADASRGS